jgi:hypothetical protein
VAVGSAEVVVVAVVEVVVWVEGKRRVVSVEEANTLLSLLH